MVFIPGEFSERMVFRLSQGCRYRQLVRHHNLYLALGYSYRIGPHILVGGRPQNRASLDREPCAVARADDYLAFQFSAGKFTAIMGTRILNGKVFAAKIEYSHGDTIHVDYTARARS